MLVLSADTRGAYLEQQKSAGLRHRIVAGVHLKQMKVFQLRMYLPFFACLGLETLGA